ncbi:hypothetical protein BGZ94_003439 [Podila epigama]|nr:hypothetical protein BGZ94_003439 [Podila epigama]
MTRKNVQTLWGSFSGAQSDGEASEAKTFKDFWKEYLIFHRQMVLPESHGGIPLAKKRFLVFTPSDDGLGNRLQALLSTVVFAMLTNRAILLDWTATPQCHAEFLHLFQQPDGLDWDPVHVLKNIYNVTKTDPTMMNPSESSIPFDMPGEWLPYCRSCLARTPITPASPWSHLLCDADLGIDSAEPWFQIMSTQWFLPVLQHNPHWRAALCQMFPNGGSNAFEILAKTLLKPSKPVQDKIESVLVKIPRDVTLIGLQVRRTENNAVGHEIEDAFLSCAKKVMDEESLLYDRNRFAQADAVAGTSLRDPKSTLLLTELEEQRLQYEREMARHRPKFAYFLATDSHATRTHFQAVLGEKLFVLKDTFVTTDHDNVGEIDHVDGPTTPPTHHRNAISRNSVQGVQTAVAEMYLLAHADRIISSPYSTFGYFAHGYANVQPNIVKRDGTCTRRKSTQPCFQYWFGFANGGAACSIRATIEMSEDYDCWL